MEKSNLHPKPINIGVCGKSITFERRYNVSMTSHSNDIAEIPQRQGHRTTPPPSEFHHEIANHYRDFKYYKKEMIPYSYKKPIANVLNRVPSKKRKHSKKLRALFRRYYKRKIARKTFNITPISYPR